MKILIATIGRRDPEQGGEPLGPLRCARELAPDRCILLATTDVLEQAKATKSAIGLEQAKATQSAMPGACEIVEMRAPDPVDTDALLADIARQLRSLGPDGEVHICATSGTPQLSMALTLVGTHLFPHARHWQALDPSRTQGPLLRKFSPESLVHFEQLRQAGEALRGMQTDVAFTLFCQRAQSSLHVARQQLPRIKAGRAVSRALAAADNLEIEEADTAVRDANAAKLGASREFLEEMQRWYEGLRKGRSRNPAWPTELLASAERMAFRGSHAAALLRVATAYEVALRQRLSDQHHVNADSVSEPALARLRLEGLVVEKRGRNVIEGLERLAKAEAALSSETLPEGHETLTQARNKLVHTGQLPEAPTVKDALEFLGQRFTSWDDTSRADHHRRLFRWTECPTRPDRVRAFVDGLQRDLT